VPVDEVGATGRCGVAPRRVRDRPEGTADRDEQQNGQGRVEQRAARPVGERPARAADRPADEDQNQHGPDPSREPESAIARGENENAEADRNRSNAGRGRPCLGLVGETARGECEQHEARAEGDECAAGDLGLGSAGEHGEDEHKAEDEPGNHRAQHDEADVTFHADLRG
jgi:hypothetical protein